MTPDIFLSYTREDQAAAQRFAEAFGAQGFSVWWDATLRSGEAYDTVTEEALRTAKAVVVLWSKRAVTSRWVRAEATLADRNRTLVPAMIEPCDRPIMFELTQTADLCRWTGDLKDPAWRAFLADVRRFVEAGAAPQPARQTAPALQSAGGGVSIAVLPFVNRSGRDEDDVFAEGVVEDLSVALSATPWIHAVAPRATAVYRNAALDVRQIGRDLGARYLLEGNVRRVGGDLRVTAQLVEAENGKILWTQKFDRPLAELAALQDELVGEVAAHLAVQLHRAETDHAFKKVGELSAWEALMRSNAYTNYATRSGWEAAVAEAQRAVELEPRHGGAHAVLATAQGQLWRFRGGDDPELAQAVLTSVRQARALDPDNAMAICQAAWALACLRNLQDSLRLAQRAVAMGDDQETTHLVLGGILARVGRSDEALVELEAAERVGPNSPAQYYLLIWRTLALLRAGRLDEALDVSERTVDLRPGAEALVMNMLCLARLDRWDQALDALRRLRDAEPDMSRRLVESLVHDFYGEAGAAAEPLAIARRLWDETSGGASSP
jgi:TolB-like protein